MNQAQLHQVYRQVTIKLAAAMGSTCSNSIGLLSVMWGPVARAAVVAVLKGETGNFAQRLGLTEVQAAVALRLAAEITRTLQG